MVIHFKNSSIKRWLSLLEDQLPAIERHFHDREKLPAAMERVPGVMERVPVALENNPAVMDERPGLME